MILEEYAMFEYIYLKNYKSFGELRFDLTDKQGNPKKMILIYGENGIGKSNLASAFFMLSETLRTMDVRDIMQSFLSERPDAINEEDFSRLIRLRYKDLETLIRENKMVASGNGVVVQCAPFGRFRGFMNKNIQFAWWWRSFGPSTGACARIRNW